MRTSSDSLPTSISACGPTRWQVGDCGGYRARLSPDRRRALRGHQPAPVASIPSPAVVRIAKEHRCWVHVEPRMPDPAAIVPELRYLMDGVDGADSLVVNPHKWLFTSVDCSVLYTKRPDMLRQALALLPEYLVTRNQDDVVNMMDYGIQLGRRFRSLKLWMVLRAYGAEGLAERIRFHCELAREFRRAWCTSRAAGS
jgi:glutamate/tyrosine decarboxylase-like PLP-dependent enzyme